MLDRLLNVTMLDGRHYGMTILPVHNDDHALASAQTRNGLLSPLFPVVSTVNAFAAANKLIPVVCHTGDLVTGIA